jgi:hypothetical protein
MNDKKAKNNNIGRHEKGRAADSVVPPKQRTAAASDAAKARRTLVRRNDAAYEKTAQDRITVMIELALGIPHKSIAARLGPLPGI